MNRVLILLTTFAFAAACGNGGVEEPAAIADEAGQSSTVAMTAKPQSPVSITYRIIGIPVVGQPVGVDIEVTSLLGSQTVAVEYRLNDSTAMQFTEAQPAHVTISPRNNDEPSLQQVRLIPLREGRLFLNVSASIETDGGTISTVTAIPIEVGAAPRVIRDNGTVTMDENGEQIRSLPATED